MSRRWWNNSNYAFPHRILVTYHLKSMYLYHAHALALGEGENLYDVCAFPHASGHAIPTIQEIGPSSANFSPAADSGRSLAQQGKFNFKNIVSFESAQTEVDWHKEFVDDHDIYLTRASVVLEGLNICNVLTADRIVMHLQAEHSADADEPEFRITGSDFDNLRIAGHALKVEYAHEYFYDSSVLGTPLKMYPTDHQWDTCQFPVRCEVNSFVKGIHGSQQTHGFSIENGVPVIAIPQLGKVYLGEVISSPGHRRINMFRLELESSNLASIAGGSILAHRAGTPSFIPLRPEVGTLTEWQPIMNAEPRPGKIAGGQQYEKIKSRYQFLIDQKYLHELSNAEQQELGHLEIELDKMEEPYYAPILRRLRSFSSKEGRRS